MSLGLEESVEWVPPSREIQNLFEVRPIEEDEYRSMPSTLAKILRRMDNLKTDMDLHKKHLTEMNNEMKSIHVLLQRYSKKYTKSTGSSDPKVKMPRGFAKPSNVSDTLCDFMGKPRGTKISRTETSAFLAKYIEENGLQNPAKKNVIVPDEALRSLFGKDTIRSEELNYFTMQKYVSPHFLK
jgi:chromatin remodeling complex protein RSC6